MNLQNVPRSTEVKKVGLPDYLEGTNGRAVLVLHGFTGLTDDMRYLSEQLNAAGFTVSVPRLPGHGTNGDDFQLTGRRDWLRRCIDSYLDLRARHEIVYVTGLSMGGLFTLILASMFPVPKIAVTAPAIVNTNRKIRWTPLLRFFVKKVRSSHKEVYSDPQREYIASEYWRWRFASQTYELYRLQKTTRKILSKISADSLIIVSKGDTAVPLEASGIIANGLSSKNIRQVVLEKSEHILVNDVEKEQVAAEILDWFSD